MWATGVWLSFSQILYILQGRAKGNMKSSLTATFYFFMIGDTSGPINPYHGSDYTSTDYLFNEDVPTVALIVLMFMSIIFSIWILSIFIGVISEAWASEKKHVKRSLLKIRCQLGLNYVLRATIIPSRLCFLGPYGSLWMNAISSLAVFTICGLQVATWLNISWYFDYVPIEYVPIPINLT